MIVLIIVIVGLNLLMNILVTKDSSKDRYYGDFKF